MAKGWDWSPWWHGTMHSLSRSGLELLTFTVRVGWAVFNRKVSDSNRLESGRAERETKPTAVHVHFLSTEPSLLILFGWLVGEAVSLWQIGHEQRGPQSNDQLRLSLDVVQRSSAPTPIFQSLKAPYKRLHLGSSSRDGEIWGFNFPTKHFCPSCANVLQLNTFQNDPPKNAATHSINEVCCRPTQGHNSQPSNLISWNRNCYVSSPDGEKASDRQDECAFQKEGEPSYFLNSHGVFQKQQEHLCSPINIGAPCYWSQAASVWFLQQSKDIWTIISEAEGVTLPITIDCEPIKDKAEAKSSLEFS